MINYMPREKTRNSETLSALKELATGTAPKEAKKIQHHADSIAKIMAAIHGGRWQVLIDHQTGYVTVLRG